MHIVYGILRDASFIFVLFSLIIVRETGIFVIVKRIKFYIVISIVIILVVVTMIVITLITVTALRNLNCCFYSKSYSFHSIESLGCRILGYSCFLKNGVERFVSICIFMHISVIYKLLLRKKCISFSLLKLICLLNNFFKQLPEHKLLVGLVYILQYFACYNYLSQICT